MDTVTNTECQLVDKRCLGFLLQTSPSWLTIFQLGVLHVGASVPASHDKYVLAPATTEAQAAGEKSDAAAKISPLIHMQNAKSPNRFHNPP